MPLQLVPDPFSGDAHQMLDAAVNRDTAGSDELIHITKYAALLTSIVGYSDQVLDNTYLNLGKAYVLVTTCDDLRNKLSDAWSRKSYRAIRRLAVLQGRATTPNYVEPLLPDLHRSLSTSFEAEYRGIAVEALYEYLTYSMSLFKARENGLYCTKICPLIQSSGTGKSRLLLELRKKDVIVLYMNLRDGNDLTGFPAQDRIPSRVLTDFSTSRDEYKFFCAAFFTTLFMTLEEHISKLLTSDNGKPEVKSWVEQLCSVSYPPRFTAREEFFAKVNANYPMLVHEMASSDTAPWIVHLNNASVKLSQLLETIYPQTPDAPNAPRVVIAIDEAQVLSTRVLSTKDGLIEYRPVDAFYQVVNSFSYANAGEDAVWVILASTSSDIANFTPPRAYNSARIAIKGTKLFAPYLQLGWDQNALKLGGVSVEDIPKVWHIAGYGRPLWQSLVSVPSTSSTTIETISSRLCGGKPFDPNDMGHVLAILGQRFGLAITPGHLKAAAYVDAGVTDHLRICLNMTLDRSWKFTNYPSEPMLSCVAAHHLHNNPGNLETALATLGDEIHQGMVELGQRGELISRLLWLLAKDLYIRDRRQEPNKIIKGRLDGDLRDKEAMDCQLIPVIEWLEFVFGEQIWDATQGPSIREHFQGAFLNFSHWITMTEIIAGTEAAAHIELDEWTARHWQRTSAIQCCPDEPLVDQMIPIYFKEAVAAPVGKHRASQIFIRHEALKRAPSKELLSKITRKDPSFVHLACEENRRASEADTLPYIVILADLGQPSEFEATYTEHDVDDRCLRIYAAGLDASVYCFLANRPAVVATLAKLMQQPQTPETEASIQGYLAAQFRFGKSGLQQHMEWERGKRVPKLHREIDG